MIDQKLINKIIVYGMTIMVGGMIFIPWIVGFPWFIAIAWDLFCGLFLFILHRFVAPKLKKRASIMMDGYQGMATITNIIQFPEFQAQYNTIDIFATITFNVEIPGRAPYTIDRKERINPTLFQKFMNGAKIPLRIDKNDKNEVVFLLDKIS